MSVTGLSILATADAGLTIYERVMDMLEKAQREGLITVEEQQLRVDRVKSYANRAGVPLIDPSQPSTSSDDPSLPPPQTGP
jgi:hypothetical protein